MTVGYCVSQTDIVGWLICFHSICLFFHSQSWPLSCFQSPGYVQVSLVILPVGTCQRNIQHKLCSLKVKSFIFEMGNLFPYFLLVLQSIVWAQVCKIYPILTTSYADNKLIRVKEKAVQLIQKSDVSGNFLGVLSVAVTSKHVFSLVSPWDMDDLPIRGCKGKASANVSPQLCKSHFLHSRSARV